MYSGVGWRGRGEQWLIASFILHLRNTLCRLRSADDGCRRLWSQLLCEELSGGTAGAAKRLVACILVILTFSASSELAFVPFCASSTATLSSSVRNPTSPVRCQAEARRTRNNEKKIDGLMTLIGFLQNRSTGALKRNERYNRNKGRSQSW